MIFVGLGAGDSLAPLGSPVLMGQMTRTETYSNIPPDVEWYAMKVVHLEAFGFEGFPPMISDLEDPRFA